MVSMRCRNTHFQLALICCTKRMVFSREIVEFVGSLDLYMFNLYQVVLIT